MYIDNSAMNNMNLILCLSTHIIDLKRIFVHISHTKQLKRYKE